MPDPRWPKNWSLTVEDWPTPGYIDPDEFGLFKSALAQYHAAQKHEGKVEDCTQKLCVRLTSPNFEAFRSRMTGYAGRTDPHKDHGASGACDCRATEQRYQCATVGCVVCRAR